ncbi:MAG: sulfite exporter TauE/SafE family protein [Ghiorsea sp.]
MDLSIYFMLTLFFSTLFAMGGVGSAIVLVSVFSMFGMPLDLAKAVGLFVNTASTMSSSVMNIWRGVLNIKLAIPLLVSLLISTPLGAYLSVYMSGSVVKWILIAFLLLSAALLFRPSKSKMYTYTQVWVLYAIGGVVGLISGLLGIGGGSLIIPLLILLGYEPKKAAYMVSFVIPFSSLGGFFTYLNFVDMNWTLLGTVTLAAMLGGLIGNRIMHYRLSQQQVKKLIAIVLSLLALKLLVSQLGSIA